VTVGHIGVEAEGEVVVLVLLGEHDLSTAPDVRAAVDEAVGSGRDVIVDLAQTEFIDSSILGVLVSGYRSATAEPESHRSFAVVARPDGPVTRLFELVAISDLIRVYPTRAAALAAVNGAAG
jgi:anti-sigma B factor antagonist